MSKKSRLQNLPRPQLPKLDLFERAAYAKGYRCLMGIDEAGRGPLAGPVVAAACFIANGTYFEGINDSKLLSAKKRQEFIAQFRVHPDVHFGVGIVDSKTIDQINIYQATIKAMCFAIDALPFAPDYLLVDGMPLSYRDIPAEKIIKGDRRSHLIAAAGIIAKETRDALMLEYHQEYPLYGFDAHKGYGTVRHKEALKKHGPTPIHRMSFAPLHSPKTQSSG